MKTIRYHIEALKFAFAVAVESYRRELKALRGELPF
jgi:hypothetical protein